MILGNDNSQGGLRFTSTYNRDIFSRLVLYEMLHTDRVLDLANLFHERMSKRNGGRMWMAAHMRRGDCTRFSAPPIFRYGR